MRDAFRFVVLSDAHAAPADAQPLDGLDSLDGFKRAVAAVERLDPTPDFVVHLGDLVGEETAEAYAAFAHVAALVRVPQYVVLGNHDVPDLAAAAMSTPDDTDRSGAPGGCYAFQRGSAVLVAMNSRVEGRAGGLVGPVQREWLAATLAAHGGTPAVVFVHHPPARIGIDWLDELGLEDGPEVLEVIRAAGSVRVVFSGHVHQRRSIDAGGVLVHTVPSTWMMLNEDRRERLARGRGFLVVDVRLDRIAIERVLI